LALAAAVFISIAPCYGQQGRISLRVVGWNMQSDWNNSRKEADPELLKEQMAAKNGVDIWGLSEVLYADALDLFEQGAEEGEGSDFIPVLGTTGGRDRLAVIYDSALFEQVGNPIELEDETALSSGLRAALVLHLKGKRTGQEFLFMVNHLKRGGAQNPKRLKQAENLHAWAKTQTLPIIAVGDYNFDYHVDLGHLGLPHRDGGFDAMIKDGVFTWVKPDRMVKSQASDDYKTILDFVFVANEPFGWSGISRILDRKGDQPATEVDFDDNSRESDHRPADAIFVLEASALEDPIVDGLKQALDGIQQEIAQLSIVGRGLTAEEEKRLDQLHAAEKKTKEALELVK